MAFEMDEDPSKTDEENAPTMTWTGRPGKADVTSTYIGEQDLPWYNGSTAYLYVLKGTFTAGNRIHYSRSPYVWNNDIGGDNLLDAVADCNYYASFPHEFIRTHTDSISITGRIKTIFITVHNISESHNNASTWIRSGHANGLVNHGFTLH